MIALLRRFTLTVSVFCTLGAAYISPAALAPSSPFQFSVPRSPTGSTVVEATTDFKNWTSIQTNSAGTGSVTVTDNQSPNFSQRFYRVQMAAAPLSDLGLLTNSVFMAGEGLNTLQFAPNGKLGFIAWRGQDLIYRERNGTVWIEKVIGRYGAAYVAGGAEEYRFQPHTALLFDSQSRAHILRHSGGSVAHHVQQADGTFIDDFIISLSVVGSSFSLFTAAVGPGDKLHLAVIPSGNSQPLKYGSNKNGSWQWSQVTTISGNSRGFLRQSHAPRWFSMAIDSQNKAHLTFCPQFVMGQSPEGYLRPYSELHYASDRGGTWFTQKVADVADGSGDAGAGASIAIAPDDQPAIASWHNERASTGSSQESHLNYHRRDGNGNWTKQLVAGNPAGYVAGDGERGTGFAPYLRFDSNGRPNIAFCDAASEHFSSSGQNEYAGNLRHAYYNGTQWIFRTIYQQTAALDRQIVYPAFATFGSEIVFVGLERKTVWQQPDYRVATSSYNWFYNSVSQ